MLTRLGPDSEALNSAARPSRCATVARASFARLASMHTVMKILVCGAIGVGIGLGLAVAEADQEWDIWLGMPGTLYLRALKCLVGPLVFCSVVLGFAALGNFGAGGGKIMKTAFGLYMVTTLCAIGECLFLMMLTKPAWDRFDAGPGVLFIEPSTILYDQPGRELCRDRTLALHTSLHTSLPTSLPTSQGPRWHHASQPSTPLAGGQGSRSGLARKQTTLGSTRRLRRTRTCGTRVRQPPRRSAASRTTTVAG